MVLSLYFIFALSHIVNFTPHQGGRRSFDQTVRFESQVRLWVYPLSIAIITQPKADIHSVVPRRVEGWDDLPAYIGAGTVQDVQDKSYTDFGACRTPMYLSYRDFVIGEQFLCKTLQAKISSELIVVMQDERQHMFTFTFVEINQL